MAPSATNGESLLDRSQRILGVSLDQHGVEKTRTRKSNVSPGRRREQVAQAQRTHRQRTQRYIRELENEVLRLRKLHKASEDKNRLLQSQVQLLNSCLIAHNVSLPSVQYSSASESLGSISEVSSPFDTASSSSPSLNIDISGVSSATPEVPCSIIAAERIPPEIDASTLKEEHMVDGLTNPLDGETDLNPNPDDVLESAVLDAQAGIDFVLQLEHPCLPHVKYALQTDIDIISPDQVQHNGPGHVFTATASLLQAAQSPDPLTHPFRVPQDEIDRLLDASRRLNLEHEITPVQVWQRIKDLSLTHHISPTMLKSLTKDFSKYAFCNSFGSVIDKPVTEVIFTYYFAPPAAQ